MEWVRSPMQSHAIAASNDARVTGSVTTAAIRQSADELVHRFWRVVLDRGARTITNACIVHGLCRSRFYRLRDALEAGGEAALYEAALRSTRHDPRSRTTIDALIRAAALAHPGYGRYRLARMLREQGIDTRCRRVALVLQRVRAGSCDATGNASSMEQ